MRNRQGNRKRLRTVEERVEAFGLYTVCLACAYDEYRHRTGGRNARGDRIRLRKVRCPRCKRRGTMKPLWWIRRFPDRARAFRRALDDVSRVFSD